MISNLISKAHSGQAIWVLTEAGTSLLGRKTLDSKMDDMADIFQG